LQKGECGFCHFVDGHANALRSNHAGSKKRIKKKMRANAVPGIPEEVVSESIDTEDTINDEDTEVADSVCSICGSGISCREKMDMLREAAEDGEAEQQFELGSRYLLGEGVQQSLEKALHWHREAAAQCHAGAQVSLGCFAQDDEEAFSWYQKAADHGDTEGQERLAVCFRIGHGVERSREMSLKWFTMAAEQGSPVAQFELGCMYAEGEGTPQCDKRSAECFIQAAIQDHEGAQVRSYVGFWKLPSLAAQRHKLLWGVHMKMATEYERASPRLHSGTVKQLMEAIVMLNISLLISTRLAMVSDKAMTRLHSGTVKQLIKATVMLSMSLLISTRLAMVSVKAMTRLSHCIAKQLAVAMGSV
jgi:hypothetical protein